jgi:hypothetical protein
MNDQAGREGRGEEMPRAGDEPPVARGVVILALPRALPYLILDADDAIKLGRTLIRRGRRAKEGPRDDD